MELKLEDFNHSVPIQVRFNDVDGLGHLNNTSIQEYFDLGRVFYLRDTLGNELGKDGRHLVIVSNKTDFYAQIMPNEAITVYSRVYQLGSKSLRMVQWVVKKGEQKPSATCDSVMVGFLRASGEGMIIPDEWRNAFNNLENGILIPGTGQ
jgi:acyl-CoA thioester hydrolase